MSSNPPFEIHPGGDNVIAPSPENQISYRNDLSYLQNFILQTFQLAEEYTSLGQDFYAFPYTLVRDPRVHQDIQGFAHSQFHVGQAASMPPMIQRLARLEHVLMNAAVALNASSRFESVGEPNLPLAQELFETVATELQDAYAVTHSLRQMMYVYRRVQYIGFLESGGRVGEGDTERNARRRAHEYDAWVAALPLLNQW